MVLELDNSKGNGQDLRAMDVSWISRFREEDERFVYVTVLDKALCIMIDI